MNLLRILDSTPEPPIVDLHIEQINASGEYTLATPIYEFQKELTDQIVSLHYSDILKYCETNDKTHLIVKSSQICIENCLLVSSHPYLLITHYMPKNLLQRDMAIKLSETSGKFNVLKDLITVITRCTSVKRPARGASAIKPPTQFHVGVVMANNSKLFDLLEALLIGTINPNTIKIKRYVGNYLRRDHKKHESSNANVTVHLIPADWTFDSKEDFTSVKFDLIIKFDEQANNEFTETLRVQNQQKPCVVIKLIPLLAIEHIKLFYKGQENESDYLYKLISSIVCLRDQIGILPPDIFPIYNKGLNYLLGFFDQLFKQEYIGNYPIWPLPELSPIPKFSAIDVEKSLLTEVNYHYTPYDNESKDGDKTDGFKKSYYQLNRLQSNYITNTLTNNFDKLLGIMNHNVQNSRTNYLTHKLMMEINSLYIDYEKLQNEYNVYESFNSPEVQERCGRRAKTLKQSLSNVIDDVNHATSRIELGNKTYDKKLEEIELVKVEIANLKQTIENYGDDVTDINDRENYKRIIAKQQEIWGLQDSVQENISKLTSKQAEKNYIRTELDKSIISIKESKQTLRKLQEINQELEKRYENFKTNDLQDIKQFKSQRNEIINQIGRERERRVILETKLTKAFRFLRDSSHLKKRKGRGLTPK